MQLSLKLAWKQWFERIIMKIIADFVRDSNAILKLLTFQLSNVIELETIKYAFARNSYHS